jgi:hypothetical protein
MSEIPLSPESNNTGLTREQVLHFHQQGYLGPFQAFTEMEMAALRADVVKLLETDPPTVNTGHSESYNRSHNRHLDSAVARRLATAPAVVSRIQAILGPDLLLWRTNFFVKHPGGKEIPWHQDVNFWPIEPPVVVSAWMAIDPATTENSCVQLIPGSHRHVVPHTSAGPEMDFEEEADPDRFDASKAVDMELRPGQFFLFTERTLHHSEQNRSVQRRIGLAVRIIPTITRVMDYDSAAHGVVVVAGEDNMGFNRPCDDSEDGR